jgi:hypothetical protein
MTFRPANVFIAVLTLCIPLLNACKNNNRHEGEVYCEVRPLQTDSGWGYAIYVDKKLYIKQEYIPAVSGMHAFKSKEDAMKTGKLVLNKLTHGKVPTISLDELKSLQIIQ